MSLGRITKSLFMMTFMGVMSVRFVIAYYQILITSVHDAVNHLIGDL